MKNIYIIGHQHPDTDSICSAVGYAAYMNASGDGKNTYTAARCGDLNAESKYALKKFSVDEPELILNVEPSVSDIPFTHPECASEMTPIVDIIKMMDEKGLRNLPITDDEGKLIGLISEHGLARAYVSNIKTESLKVSPIDVETLSRILHGKIFVKKRSLLEGYVYISIDALHVILSKITENDIAIVGDDEPIQLALASAKIAALIIADSAPVGERLKKTAEEMGVTLIGTDADAFSVAKMLTLTLPAKSIMTTDAPTVRMADTMEYVKQIVSGSKYRAACIVDENGKFLGTVSRNSIIEDVSKSVILVDHNEYSQAVKGIETADIVEIIDHHRLGAMATLQPIRFDMEPVGSTSTIIAGRFMASGIKPEKGIAGVLLSGILSDTLGLKMSTTTKNDETAVRYLSECAGIDAEKYAQELIEEGMSLSGVSQKELIERDTKEYNLSGRRIIAAQVLTPSYDFAKDNKDAIYEALRDKMNEAHAPDIYIALYTSVSDMGSDMFAVSDVKTTAAMHWEKPIHLKGVVSRKKDFIPYFGKLLDSVR